MGHGLRWPREKSKDAAHPEAQIQHSRSKNARAENASAASNATPVDCTA